MSENTSTTQPYRPFIDPLPVDNVPPAAWYITFIPLILAIAVCYKAIRAWNMKTYWRQVLTLTLVIIVGAGALAGAISLATEFSVG
ncbi:MAG: hypothetical protein AAF108_08510 [Planctomycetota bacterium]